jgi:peroxiredoxin
MSVETDQRFPLDLAVLAGDGSRVTVADLRGQARAVALYFMRTGTCPVCVHHARVLARQDLPDQGVQPVVVVPGPPAHSARVRRLAGDGVTVVSSAGAQAHQAAGLHRTLLLQHSGVVLVDAAGAVHYRLVSALPTGSFDGPALRAAVERLRDGRR